MRAQHQILENLNSDNKQEIDDQFGTIEKELFKLKELVNDEKTLKFIQNTVLELNNFRMDYWNDRITESDNYEELDDVSMYKNFNHVNDVWDFLESSTSEEDLKDKISQINPREFGTIYYDLHEDKNGATVIIDFQSDDEDYYEKVDVYFNEN